MPIWLRKLTYKKIEKHFKDENDRIEKQNNVVSQDNLPNNMAMPPQFTSKNSYQTGASKK